MPDPKKGPAPVEGIPKDAVIVKKPDGATIYDPQSPIGKLVAPPYANFYDVYAAGQKIKDKSYTQQLDPARSALQQFGTFDYQRDKATNTNFKEYVPAANYAVGVYMAGAGYALEATYTLAQTYALFYSSNRFDYGTRGRPWIKTGWDDATKGVWQKK